MMIRVKPKYTEVLINLMENNQTKTLLDKAMSTYTLYKKRTDDSGIPCYIPTRDELNSKILNYYKYREIGFETVGRFLDELEISLNEIMPYYNQLFYSADQDYNIQYNADYTKDITRIRSDEDTNNTSGENTENNNSDNYTKNVNADTPQNVLNISNKNIDNVNYANNANWNKDSLNSNSNTTSNVDSNGTHDENETISEHLKGNYGMTTTQSLIKQYRENIINIEQMIIRDKRISELFMTIF